MDKLRGLRAAHQQGHLDALIEHLEANIKGLRAPMPPDGAEWPCKRAYVDGQLEASLGLYQWLMGRLKASPDAAENTEGHNGTV